MTKVGDVVLVYMDNNPAFFARVEQICDDVKPDWFQVKLLVLQVPLLTVTWILREAYYNGREFTMAGRPVRIEKVGAPAEEDPGAQPEGTGKSPPVPEPGAPEKQKEGKTGNQGKVISIADRRKKDPEGQ
ncbi:MAG TPA: hypothetical protein VEF34_21285 [Syntrophobacteraceae bacterium]|nr:hypothetical protein [Syntrophobacteraceae bacterium]